MHTYVHYTFRCHCHTLPWTEATRSNSFAEWDNNRTVENIANENVRNALTHDVTEAHRCGHLLTFGRRAGNAMVLPWLTRLLDLMARKGKASAVGELEWGMMEGGEETARGEARGEGRGEKIGSATPFLTPAVAPISRFDGYFSHCARITPRTINICKLIASSFPISGLQSYSVYGRVRCLTRHPKCVRPTTCFRNRTATQQAKWPRSAPRWNSAEGSAEQYYDVQGGPQKRKPIANYHWIVL